MQLLFYFVFLILIFALFWLLHRIVVSLRYDLYERYLGCRSLAAVLIELAAVNVFSFPWILKWINALLTKPELQKLWETMLPQRSFKVLFMLLVFLTMNMIMLLLTIVVLSVVRVLFLRKKEFVDVSDKGLVYTLMHLPWLPANRLYEEEDGKYILTEQGFAAGLWAKGIKQAFLLIWFVQIIFASVSLIWLGEDWNEIFYEICKAWYQVPFALFLFAEQVQFFLEGDDLFAADSYRSEAVKGVWKGDLDALMKAYARIFKGSGILIHSHIEEAEESAYEMNENQLGIQQRADCDQPEALEILSNQLRNGSIIQNPDYQNALVALLNGKNINVCDYSRGEFMPYLAAYLNYHFSLGRTALLICETEERALSFAKAIQTCFERLNIIGSVWNICTRRDANDGQPIHAMAVSGDCLAEDHLLDKYPVFSKRLFLTVLEDGDIIFTKSSVEITRIFHEIKTADRDREELQYLVFSPTDNTDLRTAMEQHIGTEIHPFHSDIRSDTAVNGIMVWKEEGIYKPQIKLGIGGSRSDYMGTAIPLALIALKYDMHRVYLLPDRDRADEKYDEVMTVFTKDVHKYLEKPINLKSAIRYSPDETTGENDLKTIILYDNVFNLPEALWSWKKYTGDFGGLFHIISPSYMLRDYFASNIEKYLQKSSSMYDMVPYHIRMKRSHMATLLISLSREGMSEKKLMEKNNELNWGYSDVIALLKDCLGVILRDVELHNVYEYFLFHKETVFLPEEGCFERETRIQLTDESVCRILNDYLSNAELIGAEDYTMELPMLRGDVYNYYLEDQVVAAGGQFYKIYSIQNGRVYAKQITPETLLQYYQVSDFSFRNWHKIENCSEYAGVGMELGTARSQRNIYGYWGSNNGNSFADDNNLVFYDCTQKNISTSVPSAYVLRISMKNSDPEKLAGMELLLALMLNELFCTLFPKRCRNIFAVTSHGFDKDVLRTLREGQQSSEHRIRSIIPAAVKPLAEDDREDRRAVVYVVEHSAMEYGMVEMLYQHREQVFSLIKDYLEWYLEKYQGSEEASAERGYLHFGLDKIPDIFAVDDLLALCRKITPDHEKTEVPESDDEYSVLQRCCTFCGRPIAISYDLPDGRCMCSMCKDHQVQAREEIESLYRSERKIMEDGYHIEGQFPEAIHIQFRSAHAIRKKTGTIESGRVLGFYEPEARELWIENGGPWSSMRATVFHELTHAWQFHNLDIRTMTEKLPVENKDKPYLMQCILEGFAVYVELESMGRINEKSYCNTYYKYLKQGDDLYSIGLDLVEEFINEMKQEGSQMTPFVIMKELEKMIIEGNYPLRIITSRA